MVGTNNCAHGSKKLSNTTWAIILMTPKPLTGSLRCACIYIAARRRITVHISLKEQLGVVYITL